MTTFTTKPTIVIVPASFTPPDFYDTFISQLSTHDYDAFAISLPSVGGKKAVTMTDDAAAISSVTSKLADEGKDIILVSHSYGAVPATESANSLGKSQRQASGKKGGISGLVYVAAFVTAPGESLEKTAGNASVDYVKVDSKFNPFWSEFITLEDEGNAKATFSNLPPAEALAWASKMSHHSAATFSGKLAHLTYENIPTTYLFTENDKGIPLEFQKSMVKAANQKSESSFTTYSCKAGHFPFISISEVVVEVVRKAAGESL